MSWTKRQLVRKALSRLGMASYVFDMGNEEWDDALSSLDAMMAVWNRKGVRVSYPFNSSPENSDLDAETDIPLDAAEAIFLNLAMRLASDFGKTPAQTLVAQAKMAYDALLIRAAMPGEVKFPSTLPAGAGSKSIDYPFLTPSADTQIQSPEEYPEFLP